MVPDESRKSGHTGPELVGSFQILDLVGEALNLIHDGADASDVRRVLSLIRERFEKCEAMLERLPGGGMTRADQEEEIGRLERELERKRSLVRRYCEHDVLARVLAQRAISEKDEEGMEDEGESGGGMGDDDMMKMDADGFPDVSMEKPDADDMLMGLDI